MTVNCFCYAYLPNPESWRFTNRSGEEVAIRPSGTFRCNSTDAMIPAVRAGLGIAIVPDFIVNPYLETEKSGEQIIPVMEEWSAPPVSLHLVTPPGKQRPARVTALLDHLAAHFSH
jgi:DNA-binding transcriptional LysR family regulator